MYPARPDPVASAVRWVGPARALTGPLPGDGWPVAGSVERDLTAVSAGLGLEVRVVVVRPASTPPTFLDALIGRPLLAPTPDPRVALPVLVVGAPTDTTTMLSLSPAQRCALERLDGRGGWRGRSIPAEYLGDAEVVRLLHWTRAVLTRGADRWPLARRTLWTDPVRIRVPSVLAGSAAGARIALIDLADDPGPVEPERGRVIDGAHAAVVVLGYRDLLRRGGVAQGLRRVAHRCRDVVGPAWLVVAVDGIEGSRVGSWTNLHGTVRRAAAQALGLTLAARCVVPLSSRAAVGTAESLGGGRPDGVAALRRWLLGLAAGRVEQLVVDRALRLFRRDLERCTAVRPPDRGAASPDPDRRWAELSDFACRPAAIDALVRLGAAEPGTEGM